MKFLLIAFPPYAPFMPKEERQFNACYLPTLGLLYIAKVLEENGHQVEILDEGFSDEKIMKSLNYVDVVGLSVPSYFYKRAAEVSKMIKEKDPSITVIIGGPHVTFHPKKSLEKDVSYADISVEGEGEHVIGDISKVLEGEKKDLSNVPGVYYKKNGKIKSGPPPVVITDLDTISFPARHLVEKYSKYYGTLFGVNISKSPATSISTSRGCPKRCRFCTLPSLEYKLYRMRSAENILEELREINEKYKSVWISDDNFLADKKRAHKILDGILKEKMDLEICVMGARADSADRNLYKKMKQAGVDYLHFGIESGNQDVLDFYNKNITLDQIRKALNLCEEFGIQSVGNFILGAPIETEKHIEQTINFACSLPLYYAMFRPLGYVYGSQIWDEAVKEGKIEEGDTYLYVADSRKGLGNFTEEELEEFCRIAHARYHFRFKFLAREVYNSFKERNFRFLKIGIMSLFYK